MTHYERFREKCFDVLGRVCVKCGATEDLEIDHKNWRTKSFNLRGGRWKAALKELKKCQTLCHRCHRKKTKQDLAEQRKQPDKHGTVYRYMHYRCRCYSCSAVFNEFRRNWRIARGDITGKRRNDPRQVRRCGTQNRYLEGCRCFGL